MIALIEKDHLGDWSPEMDCCLGLTVRQPVREPSSCLISMALPLGGFSNPCERQLHITNAITVLGNRKTILPGLTYAEVDPVTSDMMTDKFMSKKAVKTFNFPTKTILIFFL